MKKIFKILLLTLTLCLTMTTAWATKAQEIADSAEVLTPVQETKLTQQMQKFYDKHQVRLAFVTLDQEMNIKAGKVANGLLDKIYNTGTKGNVLFLVNTKTRDWYIATDKKAKAMITDKYGINALGQQVVPALKDGDYNAACEKFVSGTDELLTYYEKNGEPMTKEPTSMVMLLAYLVGAIVLGAGGAFVVGCYLESEMDNVEPATEAGVYLVKDSFDLIDSVDTFLYTTFVRTPKNTGSSNNDNTVTESSSDDDHGGGGGKF